MRSKLRRIVPVSTLVVLAIAGGAVAAPRAGTIDRTFSVDGRRSVAFPGGAEGNAVAMQGRKIVVAGDAGFEEAEDLAVVRFDADGKLDRTFGGGDGRFTKNIFSDADLAHAVAVLPDGKILVAGQAFDPVAGALRFLVLRLTKDGKLDRTFGGGDGVVTTPFGPNGASGHAMTVLPDGRFVVCGYAGGTDDEFALARYRPGGALDPTFGGTGMVTTAFPGTTESRCAGVTRVGNQLVAVGEAYDGVAVTSFAVARYRANGSLASGFDADGMALFDPTPAFNEATSVVTADGGAVVAGTVTGPVSNDVALIRILGNGTLDPTFGGGDGVTIYDAGSVDQADGLLQQPNGKLVLVGFRNPDMFVARFRAGGAVDTSFAHGGLQARPWPAPSAGSQAVWDHGAIVVTGTTGLTSILKIAVERLHG